MTDSDNEFKRAVDRILLECATPRDPWSFLRAMRQPWSSRYLSVGLRAFNRRKG